jgi:predicted nucleic acid-binding Zn ribbon protein
MEAGSEPLLLQTPLKRCIACSEPVAISARICSKCKEFQSKWRNDLRYWAGIAGLFVLIGSGLLFSAGAIRSGIDYWLPPKPIISELNSFGRLSLINMSNQNIWLKHLEIRSTEPLDDLLWDLHVVIKPREPFSQDLISLAKAQFSEGTDWRDVYEEGRGAYAQDLKPDDIKEIKGHVRSRFMLTFLHSEGAEFKQVNRLFGSKLTKFTCSAKIGFSFVEKNFFDTLDIPCTAVPRHRAKKPYEARQDAILGGP